MIRGGRTMWQFLLGFYISQVLQIGALVYIALPQSKPKWSQGQRAAASLALGLFWPILAPWIMRQVGRRVEAGRR